MIKAALFDMDGVLVDNMKVHFEAFGQFCERYGVEGWLEQVNQMIGMGNEDIMRRVLPAELLQERGIDSLSQEKEALYREIYAPRIAPIAGLRELLVRLREKGIRCAVGSSGIRANVDFVLEKCGIGEFFEKRISGDMVTRCKPDPEIYLTAAQALGVQPEECIVFEDALVGIEAASRAGVSHTIALVTSLDRVELERSEARYVVNDFREVTDEMLS